MLIAGSDCYGSGTSQHTTNNSMPYPTKTCPHRALSESILYVAPQAIYVYQSNGRRMSTVRATRGAVVEQLA